MQTLRFDGIQVRFQMPGDIQVGSKKAIWINGVKGLQISGNRFMNDDREVKDPSPFIDISECVSDEAQTIPENSRLSPHLSRGFGLTC